MITGVIQAELYAIERELSITILHVAIGAGPKRSLWIGVRYPAISFGQAEYRHENYPLLISYESRGAEYAIR